MSIADLTFNAPLLDAARERELARRIEAARYAQHLIASGDPRPDLPRLVRRGNAAWKEFWLANLRLVASLAQREASRHGLGVDDLFQEGCLALADAMARFDHTRGTRFSTLAHEYIRRHLAAVTVTRAGDLTGPLHRHRLRQRLRQVEDHLLQDQQTAVSRRDVARAAGISQRSASVSQVRITSLDEVSPAQVATSGDYEHIETHGTCFLDLLAGDGWLLRHRYGIGVPAMTQAQVASVWGVSASSVARQESRALARARKLLSQDRCVLPAA